MAPSEHPETYMSAVASDLRLQIEAVAIDVKSMMEINAAQTPEADAGETKANIMLAYRHLEDARMRLGKVIQAQDGGKSVYDK